MGASAIFNSPGIFLQGSQLYQNANSKIFDAITAAADMYEKRQMQREANLNSLTEKQMQVDAEKQKNAATIMSDPEKVSMAVLTKFNSDPSSVTPADKAAFEAAQKVLGAKVSNDALGRPFNPYQPIQLGSGSPTSQFMTGQVKEESLQPRQDGILSPVREGYKADGTQGYGKVGDGLLPAPPGAEPEKVTGYKPLAKGTGISTASVKDAPAVQAEQAKADIEVNAAAQKGDIEDQRKKREALFNSSKQFRGLVTDFDNISKTVDKAVSQSSRWNTGALAGENGKGKYGSGYVSGGINLNNTLKTIQADSAFGTLQDIRDKSPTGGALGGVSERELDLLSKAKVALEQSQDESQLDENLKTYKEVRKNAIRNVAEAFKDQYGAYPEGYDAKKFSAEEKSVVNAPESAIKHLKDNPKLWSQFDAKYGSGASRKVLGK